MKNKIFNILEEELKKNEKLVDLKGNLLRIEVLKEIEILSEEIINIILKNNILKENFIKKYKDYLILDKEKLKNFFNNKEFLPDSYTQFKNKIGLSSENKYLDYNSDVVIDFPFKDCVLVGSQDKEDSKRMEKFYNEKISIEEIDELFNPKCFVNIKKISNNGIENKIKFNKKDNLLIKGNNLIALHSLKKVYAEKIKLIYIDVPYNTGSDSFGYNDNFNHSTWLTFMKNRLEVARDLLANDGMIVAQCDDNEQAYLKVLMDEVFGINGFINTISVEMSSSGGVKAAHKTKKIPTVADYLLFYRKKESSIKPLYDEIDEYDSHYSIYFDGSKFSSVTKEFGKMDWNNKNFKDNIYKNINNIFQSRSVKGQLPSEASYIDTIDGFELYNVKNELYRGRNGNFVRMEPLKLKLKNEKLGILRGNIWKNYHKVMGNISKEGGVTLKSGKKPESLIKDIISMTTKEGDIVLDFFGGSGTTAAVAHKMNRQYICIEQMDYIETITKNRLINVINGDDTGISEVVDWQGGGSFIYMEIKEVSIEIINKINISNENNISEVFDLISKYEVYLNSDFSIDLFKNKDFISLSLEDKKTILINMIDKNTIYLNFSNMEDNIYNVNENEICFNNNFYGEK